MFSVEQPEYERITALRPTSKFAVLDTLAYPTRFEPLIRAVMPNGETTGPPQGQYHPARMVSSDYVLVSSPPPHEYLRNL